MNTLRKIKTIRQEWEAVKKESRVFINQTETRQSSVKFAEAYKRQKVNENKILYESYWGRGMIDNPYAIFLELMSRDKYQKFTHIWVLDDFEKNGPVLQKYQNNPQVQFVLFGSQEYLNALASAKYLINNTTFPHYFVKKQKQIYMNTWHGTPLKSMGYDVPDGSSSSANTIRNFLHADYLLSANKLMTKMYLKSYKLEGILPGQIIEEGQPRNDLLVRGEKEPVYEKLRQYGISIENEKKIILYAPTWREAREGGLKINPDELIHVKEKLEENIDTNEYQILIKPHQYVYQQLKDREEYRNLLIPAAMDANELMVLTDILISDYSSIFLDYMVLDRPILFYVPDLENYKEMRGLDIKLEDLPGAYSSHICDIAGYIKHIEWVQQEYKEKYQEMKQNICGMDDGNVCQRIVDGIFEKRRKCRSITGQHRKKRLLISCGGLAENGITHSFMSLLEQIDYNDWDVTALVGDNPKDRAKHRKVNGLNQNVRTLVLCGFRASTLKEEQRRMITARHGLYHPVWKGVCPWEMYEREYRRIVGMAQFDYIVDFQGYNVILTSVLSRGKAKKKAIWLHNDILADMNKKVNGKKKNWESLHYNVSMYPYFDFLVSCSKEVMKVNREKLSVRETYGKFRYAKNTVNQKRIEYYLKHQEIIKVRSREYLMKNESQAGWDSRRVDIVRLPERENINFLTMGRMSVEKNHTALIHAFSRLHEKYETVRLFIIGAGPLDEKIRQCISDLDLCSYITLTGNIENPFAFMKRSDCFILPSIHEGQPMVLLEARVCGLPIIVSDFSTVNDSLYPDGQLLIGTDEESIYNGLKTFIEGTVPKCEFDLETYNQEAYEEFQTAIQ